MGRTTSANTLELVRTTKILPSRDSNSYFLVWTLLIYIYTYIYNYIYIYIHIHYQTGSGLFSTQPAAPASTPPCGSRFFYSLTPASAQQRYMAIWLKPDPSRHGPWAFPLATGDVVCWLVTLTESWMLWMQDMWNWHWFHIPTLFPKFHHVRRWWIAWLPQMFANAQVHQINQERLNDLQRVSCSSRFQQWSCCLNTETKKHSVSASLVFAP